MLYTARMEPKALYTARAEAIHSEKSGFFEARRAIYSERAYSTSTLLPTVYDRILAATIYIYNTYVHVYTCVYISYKIK